MDNGSFAFGKNWQLFIKDHLNEERMEEAKNSLIKFLDGYEIRRKNFIDVGCGSGLFSLAAHQSGASRVISFDVDPHSILCCQYLREKEGNPSDWQILKGSILDKKFVSEIGKHDIVYAWGVLHHTGNMWEAIENTLSLVADKGLLYLAIYNKSDCFGIYPDGRFGSSEFWRKEKQFYYRRSLLTQNIIDYMVMAILFFLYTITLNNPIRKIREHKKLRGMSWRIDIKDWLGGYPYEYASIDEIFDFVTKFGFSLKKVRSYNGLGNNEYLFRKD